MHEVKSERGHSHLHVLVAEDDALIAFDVEQTLVAQFGFKVSVVHKLSDGLGVLGADPPHLAVLDVNLDGEDIAPLASQLAALGAPIVFLSGYRSHPLELLADGRTIEKPHSTEDLVSMIRAALGRLPA
jgi:DNA-binding response OmpR family regulator